MDLVARIVMSFSSFLSTPPGKNRDETEMRNIN